VRTVAVSSLPKAEKVALFRQACDRWVMDRREPALRELHAIDGPAFLECWVRTLSDLNGGSSADGTVPDCEGLDVLVPVLLLARTEIDWDAVIRVLKRRPIKERMEVLRSLGQAIRDDKGQPFNVGPFRLICELFPDRNVVEAEKGSRWQVVGMGNTFSRLTVGDYAALILADYFDLGIYVCEQSPPAEWVALREKVKAAVEKELAGKK
jgi:hypothetical protein